MANRYTITKNTLIEYDKYIIDRRIAGPDVVALGLRDWIDSMIVASEKKKEPKKFPDKIKFHEFVYLSQVEYNELISGYGLEKTKAVVQRLNDYIGSKGDKYKSHFYTIITWFQKNGDKRIDNKPIITQEEEKKKEFIPMTEEQKQASREILQKARYALLHKGTNGSNGQ